MQERWRERADSKQTHAEGLVVKRRRLLWGFYALLHIHAGLLLLLLLLKEAVDLEPVGTTTVAGAAFRHSH